jgi:hypothetical protein
LARLPIGATRAPLSSSFTESAPVALRYASSRNTITVQPGLGLPLERVSVLEGDVGRGPWVPVFVVTRDGVYVGRKGRLSFYAHGLQDEIWRRETWGDLCRVNEDIVSRSVEDLVGRYSTRGERLAEVHTSGSLQAADEGCVVAWTEGELVVTEWTGRVRWRRKTLPNHVLLDGARMFLVEAVGCRLVCLDSMTGAEKWDLRAPEERRQPTDWLLAGFPSVAVVGERLILIGRDGRVQLVEPGTGTITATTMPRHVGSFLVSESAVYFFSRSGWSALDVSTLTETAQQEYGTDVVQVQGGVLPAAYWISDESVLWTTLSGQVMGVSRYPDERGKRIWWSDDLKSTLAIGEPPVHESGYLYVGTKGRGGSAGEIVCYRSA